MRALHPERGFTLLEVIVAVSVIAVVTAMVLPQLGGSVSSGRSVSKMSDLREMTVGVVRYFEAFKTWPVAGALPTVEIRDVDGDGTVRVALDTANANGQGALPANIDVTCATPSTNVSDAIGKCFARIDPAKLFDFLDSRPQNAGQDVTLASGGVPTYDDQQATPDWKGSSLNLAGWNMWIYVKDDGGVNGTAFPTGALTVWNLDADGKPWALKESAQYGK